MFSLGVPPQGQWFCPECSKCVVCSLEGGRGVYLRFDTLNYGEIYPTGIFYCSEHEQVYLETLGLKYTQLPKDLLQHFLEYLTYQRRMLVGANTSRAGRWLPYVNGLMHDIDGLISQMTAAEIAGEPHAEPAGLVIKETIKEIVKVPCSHCGTLSPVTEQKCPSCGAPLLRR
jgi:hypothetical protein